MGSNSRLCYIDIVKAIAILLLATGHALGYSEHSRTVYKLIYCFVVPLFFLVSGFTASRRTALCTFVKKRFWRIMIPYFIWAILFLVPYALFGDSVGESVGKATHTDYLIIAKNILWGVGVDRALQQNSTLWFLPALFVTEVVYFLVIRCCTGRNKWHSQICALVILMAIGHLSNRYLRIVFPWGINTMLTAGVYYYVGYLLRQYEIVERIMHSRARYGILIMFASIGIAAGMRNSLLNFMHYKIDSMWLAYLSGSALSVAILCVSYMIGKNPALEYVGRNTMSIMIFHKLPIIVFQTKLGRFSKLLTSSSLWTEVIMAMIVAVFAAMCALLAAQVLRRIAPYSIGESVRNEVGTR